MRKQPNKYLRLYLFADVASWQRAEGYGYCAHKSHCETLTTGQWPQPFRSPILCENFSSWPVTQNCMYVSYPYFDGLPITWMLFNDKQISRKYGNCIISVIRIHSSFTKHQATVLRFSILQRNIRISFRTNHSQQRPLHVFRQNVCRTVGRRSRFSKFDTTLIWKQEAQLLLW